MRGSPLVTLEQSKGALRVVGVVFAAGGIALAGAPMLGVFLGKSLGESAVSETGFGWVVLAVAALAAGAVPALHDVVQRAAAASVDRIAYAGAVLHGTGHYSAIAPGGLKVVDFVFGALALLLAVAIAATALFGAKLIEAVPQSVRRPVAAVLERVRGLHSGHIGDYVAWLTAGAAALGGLIALAVR